MTAKFQKGILKQMFLAVLSSQLRDEDDEDDDGGGGGDNSCLNINY